MIPQIKNDNKGVINMTNKNRVNEIINQMAELLEELNQITVADNEECEYELIHNHNDWEDEDNLIIFYDPDDGEEYELIHDPNDWEDEEDLYAKYYPEDEDDYDEVYDIIKPEYVERARQGKAFYINTYEYHCMLVLRTIGVQLNYWEAKEFLEAAEQRSMDFEEEKHPWSWLDEDIINSYRQYHM